MNNDQLIAKLADQARLAARSLRASDYMTRKSALLAIADEIERSRAEILAANKEDVERERAAGLNESLLDRLLLTDSRISGIIGGAKKVAELADPLGRVINSRKLENGLELTQVSVPFGVVGMIYEARPNVTVDAAVILLMSGNAALLRGSSTAKKSNEVLVEVIKRALSKTSIS
ncbi:MAG: gamma-glutamyl-phosphate reductase, partial [Actinomycetota bacterium]